MWAAEHHERYKDNARCYPSDLTDTEGETIVPFLASHRTLTMDLREMVNPRLFVLYQHPGGPGRVQPS